MTTISTIEFHERMALGRGIVGMAWKSLGGLSGWATQHEPPDGIWKATYAIDGTTGKGRTPRDAVINLMQRLSAQLMVCQGRQKDEYNQISEVLEGAE